MLKETLFMMIRDTIGGKTGKIVVVRRHVIGVLSGALGLVRHATAGGAPYDPNF